MRKRFLVPAVFLALMTPAYAQEQTQSPIDKALDACIEKNGSTAGMTQCTETAFTAWDKELNRSYGEFMRQLKPAQKEALRLSQLEWIKYRDLEFKFIDAMYDSFEGTMYIPMRVDARLEVVKKRALELKHYLETYKDASQ
jgi:uncharacterized protein YecT (DUF1311 family)